MHQQKLKGKSIRHSKLKNLSLCREKVPKSMRTKILQLLFRSRAIPSSKHLGRRHDEYAAPMDANSGIQEAPSARDSPFEIE